MTLRKTGSFVLACLLVATLMVARPASAATATETFTATGTSTLTDWTQILNLSQFNATLGTLQSVQLQIGTSLSTVITVTNTSTSASSGSVDTQVALTGVDPSNLISVVDNSTSTNYSYNLAGGAQITSGTLTGSGFNAGTSTAANVLAEFTGSGTIGIKTSTFTQTYLANTGGNTAAVQTTYAAPTATVIYTYSTVPTPEPAATWLFLGGFGGLLMFRRRQTSVQA